MLDNADFFRLGSLYLSIIGIILEFVTLALCGLLHSMSCTHQTAQRLSSILIVIALFSAGLALIGIGAWVYAFENATSELPPLPNWSIEMIKALLPN